MYINTFSNLKRLFKIGIFTALLSTFEVYCYEGPLFDAMAQLDERPGFEKSISRVRDAGIYKIALFARSREYLGENEKALLNLHRDNKDLIVLGAPKYFLHENDIGKSFTKRTLKNIDKYKYSFVGEILFTHADKCNTTSRQHESGEIYRDPSGKGFADFLVKVSSKNIPVMTHWEFYAWERDWPKFSKLFLDFPNQKFIIPHMGFGSPKQAKLVLSTHDNVYMTISKKNKKKRNICDPTKQSKLGSAFLNDEKQLKNEWKEILIEYQDKLLFATDAHKKHRWKKYSKIVRIYRDILNQLPEEVAKKIAYLNAEKIYNIKN